MTEAQARTVRTGLQKTRDVALTVMAVVVSIFCAVMLYFTVQAGAALSRLGDLSGITNQAPASNPDPIPTGSNGEPCVGEVSQPGC